jgi:microcin C transport system substrate-binding protein
VFVRISSAGLALIGSLGITAACGGGGGAPASGSAGPAATPEPAVKRGPVSSNKADYPVFPDPDAGADSAVPADQGGKGFTGKGWQTNTDFELIGDPRAVKGGTLRQAGMTDFPSTLRYWGPNRTAWNLMLHSMAYETLVDLHPTSMEYIPMLATHWQVSEDKQTFRFRLDPSARWSDGAPVVAEDVIASWKLVVDKTIQDPAITNMYSNFDAPIAESKYIVSVHAKTVNWQNFLYFAQTLFIYPAHALKGLTGETYVRQYNYKLLPGTGAYTVAESDVEKGKSIRIRRRQDYWAEKHRRNIGRNNFDVIQQVVVRDRNLEFEMVKRGDLDYYIVSRAQVWAQELEYPNIKRGLQQKRKVFNHNPQGILGIAINTRREPYDDIRVRKALRHLYNRELMIEKLMFNEYVPMDSAFPGSVYENPANEKIRYDPQKALQLLAEAGWTTRDSAGRLTKNGRPLQLEMVYPDQQSERHFTIFQEDLRRVGIGLNLRLVTFETLVKLLDERTFDMAMIGYTGELFPSPETSWLSSLADEKNTNNITGFKNPRADDIIHEYGKTFDFAKRVTQLRELDGIFSNQHHWIYEWTAPFVRRFVFLNKFGMPKGVLTRIGDDRDVPTLWWIDPDKAAKYEAALKDQSIQLGEEPSDDKYWLEFAQVESKAVPAETSR